jgi:anti-sigma regulatory factor (Ser/Thr protein kinase)
LDHTSDGGTTALLPMVRPETGYAPVAEWTLDDAEQLSLLRSGVARLVSASTPSDGDRMHDTAEKIVLIASELATNALRHGLPPTVVRLLRRHDTWLLDVADHDASTGPAVDSSRPPGYGGLGLVIAERLSLEVGWYTSGTTKHVWATFPAGGSD